MLHGIETEMRPLRVLKFLAKGILGKRQNDDDAYRYVEISIRSVWAKGVRAHIRGSVKRATTHWTKAMKLQVQLAEREGTIQDFRFFGPIWTGAIGHIAHLTTMVQAKELGLYKPHRIVVDAHFKPANICYLKYLEKYCDVIWNEEGSRILDTKFKHELPAVVKIENKWVFFVDAIRIVQQHWLTAGRAPLFELDSAHSTKGRRLLSEWGIPQNGWFVTLHVREKGHVSGEWTTDSVRNCSIDDYLEAIKIITSQGGWVIRIGGSDYEPLPQMENVIDYATTKIHEDWIDVFLLAAAKFMIATNSGPPWVAVSFGVPVLFTNWAPRGIDPFWPGTTVLKKKLYYLHNGRLLSEYRQRKEPIAHIESISKLQEKGLGVKSNSTSEIAAATLDFVRKTRLS